MQDLSNKTAVITGAGSGFGREFAKHCAAEGMNLVLADLNHDALLATVAELPNDTPHILQTCDVSKPEQVDALAQASKTRFGATHLLFNNAGVAVTGPVWTATLDEWRWVLDVNLMGVVHGLRAFTQDMIDSGEPCHIVNTASAAGHLSVPGSGVYCVSKHAVVTMSECLYHELNMLQAQVGVSLLCPAFVPTGIADSENLRPQDAAKNPHPMTASTDAMTKHAVASGRLSAADVARITLDAVKANRFYVFPHEKIKNSISGRFNNILNDAPPHNSLTDTK
ncbi:MAG: SDR family NAD(P)-dependent oxidoreductase [Oceanococcus sp.]